MEESWTSADWEAALHEELGCPVRVTYGRSRTVPIQAKGVRVGGRAGFEVRMHRMFAAAPAQVRADLARWLKVGRRARKACTRLDDWIAHTLAQIPRPARLRSALEPKGQTYDLEALARPLFLATFAGDFHEGPRPALTWGRRRRSASSFTMRRGRWLRRPLSTAFCARWKAIRAPSLPWRSPTA